LTIKGLYYNIFTDGELGKHVQWTLVSSASMFYIGNIDLVRGYPERIWSVSLGLVIILRIAGG